MADANPNQSIFDQTVRHRIAIERYSVEDAKAALKFLDELKADIAGRIARASEGRRAQLETLLDDIREIHGRTYQRIQSELSTRFRDRAAEAAEFHAEKFKAAGIEASINRLTADAAYQAALTRPMDGAVLSEWLTAMEPAARGRIDRALRISWTEGESLSRAVARVREGIDISKRSARTLVRTANTHISNAVQQASAEANSDLVKEVEWRSVLDSRTTPICQSRSGQRYPVNSGPRPPAHSGCRSIVIEVLKDFPPPKSETYAEWLKRQPAEVQDDVLGPNRGALLRSGKYDVGDFVDVKGTPLTLAEIRAGKPTKVRPKTTPPKQSKKSTRALTPTPRQAAPVAREAPLSAEEIVEIRERRTRASPPGQVAQASEAAAKRIEAAIPKLQAREGDFVKIADLKNALRGLSDREIDDTLRKMLREQRVLLSVQDDQGSLTREDRETGVPFGQNIAYLVTLIRRRTAVRSGDDAF